MKNLIATFALSASVFTLNAQVSETRNVGPFTGIHFRSIIECQLTQGDTQSVVVKTSAGQMKKVITEVKDNVLYISYDGTHITEDIHVFVTVKKISSIEYGGASELRTTNELLVDSLHISGSGSGDARIDLKAKYVSVALRGASELKLKGSTVVLEANTSGASDLKAAELTSTGATTINSSGASSVSVTTHGEFSGEATGSADVVVYGKPSGSRSKATGAASIVMRDVQFNSPEMDTVHIGDVDIRKNPEYDYYRESSKRTDRHKFWQGLSLGVNGYLNAGNTLEMDTSFRFLELNYAKSYVFGLNAFQKNLHIYKNYVNLGVGLGLTWYHYNFRSSYTLNANVPYASATNDSANYWKNRLNMCYVNIPLFLEFNSNNNKASESFHIAIGVQAGYNIFTNKVKQKFEENDQKFKRKITDDFNINPFRTDVIVRLGYGSFTLFGSYSFSTLFESGKGPVVYPFAVGFTLSSLHGI